MGFINPCHRGLAYGDGYMDEDGQLGRLVSVVGDDQFAVNTDPAQRSFGILMKDYAKGDMPGIYCNGGIYETDVFKGNISAGDELKVATNGKLTAGVGAGDLVVAQAISVQGGILKFRLLV